MANHIVQNRTESINNSDILFDGQADNINPFSPQEFHPDFLEFTNGDDLWTSPASFGFQTHFNNEALELDDDIENTFSSFYSPYHHQTMVFQTLIKATDLVSSSSSKTPILHYVSNNFLTKKTNQEFVRHYETSKIANKVSVNLEQDQQENNNQGEVGEEQQEEIYSDSLIQIDNTYHAAHPSNRIMGANDGIEQTVEFLNNTEVISDSLSYTVTNFDTITLSSVENRHILVSKLANDGLKISIGNTVDTPENVNLLNLFNNNGALGEIISSSTGTQVNINNDSQIAPSSGHSLLFVESSNNIDLSSLNLSLSGPSVSQILSGAIIYGSGDISSITGSQGNDSIHGSDTGNVIYAGSGIDQIYAGAGDDQLNVGVGGTEEQLELIEDTGGTDTYYFVAGVDENNLGTFVTINDTTGGNIFDLHNTGLKGSQLHYELNGSDLVLTQYNLAGDSVISQITIQYIFDFDANQEAAAAGSLNTEVIGQLTLKNEFIDSTDTYNFDEESSVTDLVSLFTYTPLS